MSTRCTRAEELAEKATSLLNEICLDSLEHPLAEQEEWMGQTSALFVQLRDVQAEFVADAEALAEALQEALDYIGVEPEHVDLDPHTPTFVHRALSALARYRGER